MHDYKSHKIKSSIDNTATNFCQKPAITVGCRLLQQRYSAVLFALLGHGLITTGSVTKLAKTVDVNKSTLSRKLAKTQQQSRGNKQIYRRKAKADGDAWLQSVPLQLTPKTNR